MSKSMEHLKEIIDRIIDLEPPENRMNKIIELEMSEDKTNKINRIK